jgi:hypothetical protein
MSYPVAYTGKGSAFETTWLKPAGVTGIPHAFIVKDGKIVLTSHPSQITDAVIEALLSGEEGTQKAVAEINAAKAERSKMGTVMQAYRQAAAKGDADAMAAQIEELKKLDPKSPQLASFNIELLVAKKDWAAASTAFEALPAGSTRQMTVMMTASKISSSPDGSYPLDFIKLVAKASAAAAQEGSAPQSPLSGVTLATLQWKSGDKDAALATAKAAAATAATAPVQPGRMALPAAPFAEFAKAMEAGTPLGMRDFSALISKALKEAQAK